jgi:hypothetical protein
MEQRAELHYIRGRMYSADSIRVTAIREESEDENLKHTVVLKYDSGKWSRSFIDNRVANFLIYKISTGPRMLSLAEDGEVIRGDLSGAVRSQVDGSTNGPSDLRHLVGLRRIGDTILTCGMRRQVYRTDLDGLVWQRIDDGIFVLSDDLTIAGLWSIAGQTMERLWAVGLEGELWTRTGATWTRRDVPTNANLYDVICVSQNVAVACGAKGVVITGGDDAWRVIDNHVTTTDFWSIAQFQGKIYLAGSTEGLFMIEDNAVVPADAPAGVISDVSTLDVVGDCMLLVGDQSVVLRDGSQWTNLAAPIR